MRKIVSAALCAVIICCIFTIFAVVSAEESLTETPEITEAPTEAVQTEEYVQDTDPADITSAPVSATKPHQIATQKPKPQPHITTRARVVERNDNDDDDNGGGYDGDEDVDENYVKTTRALPETTVSVTKPAKNITDYAQRAKAIIIVSAIIAVLSLVGLIINNVKHFKEKGKYKSLHGAKKRTRRVNSSGRDIMSNKRR